MLKMNFLLIVFGCLAIYPSFAQTKVDWQMLSRLTYVEKEGTQYYVPEFSQQVNQLQGKEVYLKGFMLVIAAEENVFILSKNPFSSCFFCGNAGPESVVELQVKPDHPKFEMDEVLTIKGVLKLNTEDLNHCNYILEQAEVYVD